MGITGGTFLQQLGSIITGKGFKRIVPGIGINSLTEADGDKLDNGSTPAMAAGETNGLVVTVAACATLLGCLNFVVPEDYDESLDYLRVRVLGVLGTEAAGTTDTTVGWTAVAYRKRASAALSSDLAPTAAGDIPIATSYASWLEFDLDGNSLQGGDVIHMQIDSEAHTTDSIDVSALEVVYKSDLVYFDKADR